MVVAQAVADHDPQLARERHVQNAGIILNDESIVADYTNRNFVDYLQRIAYSIHI